jgi:alpha-beta hydrolase superfamily lysophospholipase
MTQRVDKKFDVSNVAGEEAWIAGRVIAPDWEVIPTMVVVCLPGGAYAKDYWDVPSSLLPGYSFAEHASLSGIVTVVLDHLGMGESTRPADGDKLTAAFVAACHDAAISQIRHQLHAGTLAPFFQPGGRAFVAGFGHSNGGCVLVNQQGRHRSYDAIGVFGYSNQYMVLPYTEEAPADDPPDSARHRARAEAMLKTVITGEWAPYLDFDRVALHEHFHWDDVAPEVVAAAGKLHSLTPRGSSIDASIPASAAAMAAAITTPIFLGFGERDVCPDPYAEAMTYRGSRDISMYVLDHAAHCTNFATNRHRLWERAVGWLASVAGQPQTSGAPHLLAGGSTAEP